MTEQPEWLKDVVEGLSDARTYSVVLEGEVYAIIRCPGGTLYSAVGSSKRYFRSSYLLVKKGINYWHGTWQETWQGRLTKEGRAVIEKALADAEATP